MLVPFEKNNSPTDQKFADWLILKRIAQIGRRNGPIGLSRSNLSARTANLSYFWYKPDERNCQIGPKRPIGHSCDQSGIPWAILLRTDHSADFWPIGLLFYSNDGTSIIVNDPKIEKVMTTAR